VYGLPPIRPTVRTLHAAALADEAEDGLHFPRRVRAIVGEHDNHEFAVVHVKISFAFWIFALLYLCEKPLGDVRPQRGLNIFVELFMAYSQFYALL
jgi:hypothetical protein